MTNLHTVCVRLAILTSPNLRGLSLDISLNAVHHAVYGISALYSFRT